MLKVSSEHTKQKVAIYGIMFLLVQIMVADASSAGRSSRCAEIGIVTTASNIFDGNDYAGTVATLLEAEEYHQGRGLICFFNLISKNEIEGQAYHQFGVALYEAAIGGTASLEADLAAKYLAGSELALRRALAIRKKYADSMQIRLALAKSLLEQMRSHGRKFLQAEIKILLETYLENDSTSTASEWARSVLRELESLSSDDHEIAHYVAEAIHLGGDVVPPEKIKTKYPQYTEDARLARVQGVVKMQVIIDQDGAVVHVKVLKGLPMGLSVNAVEAVEAWELKPATLHGEPVAVFYYLATNFRLEQMAQARD